MKGPSQSAGSGNPNAPSQPEQTSRPTQSEPATDDSDEKEDEEGGWDNDDDNWGDIDVSIENTTPNSHRY